MAEPNHIPDAGNMVEEEERQAAYLWCDATHRASTGESVDVPAKPECLAVLMGGE